MPITQEYIDKHISEAKKDPNAICVLVVCDMFDWSDYCVTIHREEEIKKYDNRQNMSKIMEIYQLKPSNSRE